MGLCQKTGNVPPAWSLQDIDYEILDSIIFEDPLGFQTIP